MQPNSLKGNFFANDEGKNNRTDLTVFAVFCIATAHDHESHDNQHKHQTDKQTDVRAEVKAISITTLKMLIISSCFMRCLFLCQ